MIRKILFVILMVFSVSSIAATSNASILKKLSNKIAQVRSLLSRDHVKRKQLQRDLEKNEMNSGEVSKQLYKTNLNLTKQQALLATLEESEKRYKNKLNSQEILLSKEVQTAYMLGRQPYLKLLLNQQDMNQVSRVLMYYQYINQDRIAVIKDLQNTVKQLKDNQSRIKSQYDILQRLQQKQKNEKNKLADIKKNRQALIDNINNKIQSRKQRLKQLLSNKHRLEKTVEQLSKKAQGTGFGNFALWRGKLHWPTKGKLLPIFGTQVEQSELRWGGVLIKAPDGRHVHAIANGTVVFAKWLSGYGLLIIINHGNGYMTLYGRNEALYKTVGDSVKAGDLIATVGKSGGYQSPALYFAIRHNSKPLNPSRWCR